jgi:phenylacetate-CoA ligase
VETNKFGYKEIDFGRKERRALADSAKGLFSNLMTGPFLLLSQIRSRQTDRIAELLQGAYESVPLYTEIFDKAGVTPAHFKKLEDIGLFPIVRRDYFSNSASKRAMSARFSNKKTFESWSCGTSGVPLAIRFDLAAVITDSLQGARQLALQSSGTVSPRDLTLHYYAYPWWTDSIGDEWRSKFVSMEAPESLAADTCRRERPAVIAGYPTALRRLISATDAGELNLKLIVTNSEQSSRLERDQLSAHFGCPVLDEYSTEELTRVAIEMPDGLYYVHEDSVFLEILNPQTKLPAEDGEWGEVIATGLLNEAMPFIRYATGDFVKRPKSPKPNWNRIEWSQLEAIGGRLQDSFLKRDNSIVPSGVIADIVHRAMVIYGIFLEDYRLTQITPHELQMTLSYPGDKSIAEVNDFIVCLRSLLKDIMECNVLLSVLNHQPNSSYRRRKRRPIRSECTPSFLSSLTE